MKDSERKGVCCFCITGLLATSFGKNLKAYNFWVKNRGGFTLYQCTSGETEEFHNV